MSFFSLCLRFTLLAAAVPRPEFPQPQFERKDWLTLNGEWQFAFDDTDAGLDARWYRSGAYFNGAFSGHITVPYCFESKLSGIADTGFHPWVWYRREVTLPEAVGAPPHAVCTSGLLIIRRWCG